LIPRLRRIFKENRADIIHARSRMPAWITYLAWRGMDAHTRPRFITSVHGPYSVNYYSRIMTRGERIIAISEFIRDYIFNNYPGIDPKQIVTIPRGVDPGRFAYGYRPGEEWFKSWKREFPQLENRCIITLPARITRWKGQTDFLHIISALNKSGMDVQGLAIGGAHVSRRGYLDELKSLASNLNIERNISFLGHRDDLREIMSISDLVLSLAKEPEAFGRTALEALAMGIPVIGYDHGGAGEVLRAMFPEGLIPPGDIDAGLAMIRRFLAHRPLVARHNAFPLERMVRSTIDLYEELCINKLKKG